MRKKFNFRNIERYKLSQSPFAQRPTQRDIASLLGEKKDDLRRLADYKNEFIVRRQTVTGKNGKIRDLAYPVGRLRAAHERFKFHLNKVIQPGYLFSPRKGKSQKDNAAHHLEGKQYLTLDLKKFYPSTSDAMVRRWLIEELGMHSDVAGLLTRICTVDGKVSFGSPVTPVLCALIHRRMFDQIADLCIQRGHNYSVWVDDLTISGDFIPGDIVIKIREIIRKSGLKSHKLHYRTGNRPVFITGIGVVGSSLIVPNTLNLKIKQCWNDYYLAETDDEKFNLTLRLLSYLGTVRQISGASSAKGRKASDQMNSLRQKQQKREKSAENLRQIKLAVKPKSSLSAEPLPWH
jgi:RNA-directed DNA polymerase